MENRLIRFAAAEAPGNVPDRKEQKETVSAKPEDQWAAYQKQVEQLEQRLRGFDVDPTDTLEDEADRVKNALDRFRALRESDAKVSPLFEQLEGQYAEMEQVIREAENALHEQTQKKENPWNMTEKEKTNEAEAQVYSRIYSMEVPADTPVDFKAIYVTRGFIRRQRRVGRRIVVECVPGSVQVNTPRWMFHGEAGQEKQRMDIPGVARITRVREGGADKYVVGFFHRFHGTFNINGANVPYALSSEGNEKFRPQEPEKIVSGGQEVLLTVKEQEFLERAKPLREASDAARAAYEKENSVPDAQGSLDSKLAAANRYYEALHREKILWNDERPAGLLQEEFNAVSDRLFDVVPDLKQRRVDLAREMKEKRDIAQAQQDIRVLQDKDVKHDQADAALRATDRKLEHADRNLNAQTRLLRKYLVDTMMALGNTRIQMEGALSELRGKDAELARKCEELQRENANLSEQLQDITAEVQAIQQERFQERKQDLEEQLQPYKETYELVSQKMDAFQEKAHDFASRLPEILRAVPEMYREEQRLQFEQDKQALETQWRQYQDAFGFIIEKAQGLKDKAEETVKDAIRGNDPF